MDERPFEAAVAGGVIPGHAGGNGAPALLLHGGPGAPDYLGGCAAELGGIFTTLRYTQRGTPPATAGPPYSVESHMEDALAVLDTFGLERAWAIGHSWGGQLALHLAVAHPERLYGVVCIDAVGASPTVIPEFRENLLRRLSRADRVRVEELRATEAGGEESEQELLEQLRLIWPSLFADPTAAPPCPIRHLGAACLADTRRSVDGHFEAGTLSQGLRHLTLPALFVHGSDDPLPLRASLETASLIRGARVARVPRCGHFPWLEQPGFTGRLVRGLFAQL